jgi:hypothetical protein
VDQKINRSDFGTEADFELYCKPVMAHRGRDCRMLGPDGVKWGQIEGRDGERNLIDWKERSFVADSTKEGIPSGAIAC